MHFFFGQVEGMCYKVASTWGCAEMESFLFLFLSWLKELALHLLKEIVSASIIQLQCVYIYIYISIQDNLTLCHPHL